MNKRRFIILAVVLLIIIIPLLLFLNGKNETTVAPTIKPITRTTIPLKQTTPDPRQFSTVQDTGYTLYFPNDWVENKSVMSNQTGIVYLLQPKDATIPSHPHITVEIIDGKLATIDSVTTEFKVFGYRKTTEILNGTQMTKYQRVIPSTHGKLNSTAFLYQKNDTIYFFKLGYMSGSLDPQLEEQLQEVVTNFTTH